MCPGTPGVPGREKEELHGYCWKEGRQLQVDSRYEAEVGGWKVHLFACFIRLIVRSLKTSDACQRLRKGTRMPNNLCPRWSKSWWVTLVACRSESGAWLLFTSADLLEVLGAADQSCNSETGPYCGELGWGCGLWRGWWLDMVGHRIACLHY